VRDVPKGDAIYFGAMVELGDEAGKVQRYRIVGPDETDAKTSAISIDSPLARALLAKRAGDAVVLKLGDKPATFTVVTVRYDLPQ
jgi:transcription elongation factor GreB